MKKAVSLFLVLAMLHTHVFAFCGFYVAGAGAKLYNKASQVIIARDGDKTVVTMESDFSGDVKQFAMVVPVPSVLKKEQIRVLDGNIFEKLDRYSAPRIVEYYDEQPCPPPSKNSTLVFSGGSVEEASKRDQVKETETARKNAVKIEAKYEIGEYSILILSAKDSDGLTTWLKANKYAIPQKAHEVLAPYVKNKLKFFVVKVNLEKYPKSGSTKLRPIQIEYTYDKFMLPIRLGMANAESVQDLTVYAFSRIGRIECSNYRTIEMPTDKNIPLRIKDKFPTFYKYAFETQYDLAGKAGIFTEYAWNISSSQYVKCDPCSSDPPIAADLHQAGAFWLKYYWNSGDEIKDMTKIADDPILKLDRYRGDVYFTRLHIRYDRAHFPDDLMFFHTPNKNNYQARYVVTHPAEGDLTCEKGKKYVEDLKIRQQSEEQMLALLIGWKEKSKKPLEDDYKNLLPLKLDDFEPPNSFHLPFEVVQGALITVIALMLLHHFRGLYRRRKTKKLI